MQETVGYSVMGIWNTSSYLTRWFLFYALIATVASFVTVARVIKWARSNAAAATKDSGDETRIWNHCSQKLKSVTRHVVLMFLLSVLVLADGIRSYLDSIPGCRYGDCAGGVDVVLLVFSVGIGLSCLSYVFYCVGIWQAERQTASVGRVM